jgi:phage gp16-like protein
VAKDEWEWIDAFPKNRMLAGEVERDRWLTREEADRLVAACPESSSGVDSLCPGNRDAG